MSAPLIGPRLFGRSCLLLHITLSRVVHVVASRLDLACLVSVRRPWLVWLDFVLLLMGLLLLLSSCLAFAVFCFALLFCSFFVFFCVSPCSVALLRLGLNHARCSVFFVYVVWCCVCFCLSCPACPVVLLW